MTNTLIAKLAQASLAVGSLSTDKENKQQGYFYISADKILERAGDALAHVGVMIIPAITATEIQAVETRTSRGEGLRYDADVTFAMTLTDGETLLEYPWRGRGSDYAVPDKAMYKAITSGHKYFLMKLLNIGVGNEDGEHEEQPQVAQKPQEHSKGHNVQPTPAPPRSAPPVQPQNDMDGAAPRLPDGDMLFGKDAPWYVTALHALPTDANILALDLLHQHRNNGGPCSPKAYGYLAGLLDSIIEQATGAGDGHKRVLAVLCQADVTGDNRPSATMVGRLLARLATHIRNDAGVKVINPNYDQATSDAMIAIYRAAENVGTPSLLEPIP